MSVTGTFTTNPSPAVAKAQMDGMDKHNLAHQLEQRGNLAGVAQMFLEALHVKERGSGPNHLSMGISYNSLGEVYAQIEKLDDAEEQFRKALEIRRRTGPAFDTAVTRENLAQLFERRGEYSAAREIRVDDEDHIACSNYHVRQVSPLSRLVTNVGVVSKPEDIHHRAAEGLCSMPCAC